MAFVNTFFEKRVERLFDLARRVEGAFASAGKTTGVHMLVQKAAPSVRRAVHLVFTGEKVRPEYPEAGRTAEFAGCV